MLKKRLIPKLLIKRVVVGRVSRLILVTTVKFGTHIEIGDPVSQAKIYEAQLADELIVINIDSSPIGEDSHMLHLIERLASETFMPLCVGGGVRSVADFGILLERGADKISINSAALDNPKLITEAANQFGAQCVVVSCDLRKATDGRYMVMADHAQRTTHRDVVAWAREATDRGAGELLICDADRDGTGGGLNCEIGWQVADAVPIPVVLSGGCGRAEHFVDGFCIGKAEGIASGTYFAFRDQNPMQTRSHILNACVPIRMET